MELEVERYTMVHTAITMTGPPGLTLEADGHKRLEDILGARERGTSRSKIAAHENARRGRRCGLQNMVVNGPGGISSTRK